MKNKFDGKEYYDELKKISKNILESVEKEVTSDANENKQPQKRSTGSI